MPLVVQIWRIKIQHGARQEEYAREEFASKQLTPALVD